MSDFKSSLMAGVAAAEKALSAQNEIYSVINDVDAQLKEVYEGKVSFGLGSFYKEVKIKNPVQAFSIGLSRFNEERYPGLAIFDSEGNNGDKIADWSMAETGYPCKISYDGTDVYCRNKEELIKGLLDLLKDVRTGKAILIKINEHDKKISSGETSE